MRTGAMPLLLRGGPRAGAPSPSPRSALNPAPCPSRSIAKSTTPIRIHVAITPPATRDALPAKKRAVSWWFWWGIHTFRFPNLPCSCWFSIPCFLFFGFFSPYFPQTGAMPNSCFHWLRPVSWENLYCECTRRKWWFFNLRRGCCVVESSLPLINLKP